MTDNMTPPAGAPAPADGGVPAGVQLEVIDKGAILAEVNRFFSEKSQERRPYEMDWFLNAAVVRMAADANFHPLSNELRSITQKEPPHRRHYRINKTRVKYLAKLAKYTNSRPRPMVIAATEDREDVMDARLTEQALLYIWRKIDLEAKYEEVTANAELTGKSFWGFRWDPQALATVLDPRTGERVQVEAGDPEVDVVPAFEILVEDLGKTFLGQQDAIMRARLQMVADIEARYGLPAGTLEGDASSDDLFQFQKQIANLGATYNTGSTFRVEASNRTGGEKKRDYAILKEYFKKPSTKHKKGLYVVVAGGRLLKYQEELPYGFASIKRNPYPFEEFAASVSPGQFWPTTMVEQLRPLQEQLSTFRSKVVEHLLHNTHGKLLVPRSAKVADIAWNSEPGEKVFYTWIPGSPGLQVVYPPALSMDVWKLFDVLEHEFDTVSNLSAATLGLGSDTESGYQANILQEANDAVFGPDRNRMQRALAASLGKIRRIMAMGYTEERLIAATGRSFSGSTFAFSQSNIDEAAEIVVQIGSALPDGKAAKLQSLMELKGSGLFGDAENPRVRRGILDLADLGGIEQEVDPEYEDANRARLENMNVQRGMQIKPPLPWQKDQVHVVYHEEFMNAPSFDLLPPPQQIEMIKHYLLHLRRIDPMKGFEVAQMFQNQSPEIAQLVPMFQQMVMAAQAPPAAPAAAPGQQPGAPAPGGPAPFQGGPAGAG